MHKILHTYITKAKCLSYFTKSLLILKWWTQKSERSVVFFTFRKLFNTHRHFTALWILSGPTRVSRYHKILHPLTSTVVINHPYLLPPSITIHGILSVQLTCLTVFFHNLSPSVLWSTSWPGTIHFILHTFLHPT